MSQQVVYLITNKVNGMQYVGQTSDFRQRVRQYRHGAKPDGKICHMSLIIREMREYGFDNFEFTVLRECETFAELDKYEKYYILSLDTLEPNGYNVLSGGGAKRKGRTHTKYKMTTEEKAKISESVIVYHKGSFKIYPSAKEFANEMECDRSIITSSIRHGKKYHGRYIYYLDDKRREEFVEKNKPTSKAKMKYYKIGLYLNSMGVETIEDHVFLNDM